MANTTSKNLEPYLAELTKAIIHKNYNEFGIAFENMRQHIDKLKPQATKLIVEKLENKHGEEFLLTLPRLIEASSSFKKMFLSHPEARAMLEQSIQLNKNSNFRHMHGIIDKPTGRKHAETLKGHILLLEHLLQNLPKQSAKSGKVVPPPAKAGHWMALRPSHELLRAEEQPLASKPRRKRPE